MFKPRWLLALSRLGLELWLPLPLLGLGFWIVGGVATDQVLSRAYDPGVHLQVNQPNLRRRSLLLPSTTVLSIRVLINKPQGISQVKINPTHSALKELTFEFPTTEASQVEAAIARELGLAPAVVRRLIHYQIAD